MKKHIQTPGERKMEDYVHTTNRQFNTDYAYEHKISIKGETVLALLRHSDILVPGYLKNEHYTETAEGLKISKVDPIAKFNQPKIKKEISGYFEDRIGSSKDIFNFW